MDLKTALKNHSDALVARNNEDSINQANEDLYDAIQDMIAGVLDQTRQTQQVPQAPVVQNPPATQETENVQTSESQGSVDQNPEGKSESETGTGPTETPISGTTDPTAPATGGQ